MASYPPYIPPADPDFDTWVVNFSTLLTADPTAYGLSAADAAAVAGPVTTWQAAWPLSQDPATRTPVTVADKDAARAAAEAVIRPFAVRVSRNQSVSNANKTALGVTVPATVPTPIPQPVDQPELALQSAVPLLMTIAAKPVGSVGKAKPFGAIGMEVAAAMGVAHTVDPNSATYVKTVTKSPFRMSFASADQGKHLTIFTRYVTRSGPGGESQVGPWSSPLQTFVL